MRPPATIKDWLSIEKMFQWVQDSPDQPSHKCRMSVWLTHTGRLHAEKVADILGVSKQAVWLWIKQYNEKGPVGLERLGRGGRRWGLLSPEEENKLLSPLIRQAQSGSPVPPGDVQHLVEAKLGQKVSKSYVYKLLKRHHAADVTRLTRSRIRSEEAPDTFSTLSKPWLRRD
jgi:transposase